MIMDKINFTRDIKFLKNSNIYEYDMAKSNINLLYYYGKISKEQYDYLYNTDRMTRQKTIGLMELKDRSISEIKHNGVIEMRKRLLQENNISEDNVLSLKNDAVFLVNAVPEITKFGNVEFVQKNSYSSFYRTNYLEFYYLNVPASNIEKLDVKGINDNKLKLHHDYMMEFLKAIFESIDYNIEDTILMLRNVYTGMVNGELDLGYYRNFNSQSMFSVNMNGAIYDFETIQPCNIPYINRDCNLSLIREIWSIVSYMKIHNI